MTVSGEGWYADPQDPARLRWWDGAAWTVHTHDPASATAHHAPLPRWWGGLTVVLQLGLLLNIAAALFVLYVDQQVLAFVEELRLRPDTVSAADGGRIDELALWSTWGLVARIGTGVVFIVWTYTLHHSRRMDRSVLRHGSGWAIGGWFVPVLSFWRPLQVVLDVRRGATGDADLATTRTIGWWWATFLATYLVNLVATYYYWALEATFDDDGGPVIDHLASAATWERGAAAISIVAAVLAIRVVREISSFVRAEPT